VFCKIILLDLQIKIRAENELKKWKFEFLMNVFTKSKVRKGCNEKET
jgi:hypothetical protein